MDDTVTLESSPLTQLRRVYDGSKLVFGLLVAIPAYLVVSIAIDSWIFVRFIGVLGLVGGLIGGGLAVVTLKAVSRLTGTTTRNEVPLDWVAYVATVEHGIVRPNELRIAYRDPEEERLERRVVWMPHRWMDEAGELEAARDVFAAAGVKVRTG